MIAVGHSASGVMIGLTGVGIIEALGVPTGLALTWLFAAGIGGHYLGDWLPHGHYRFDLAKQRMSSLVKLGLDLVLPLALLLGLTLARFGLSVEFWAIMAAIIGALAPDIWENILDLGWIKPSQFSREHRQWHYQRLHWHNDASRFDLPNGGRSLTWLDSYQIALLGLSIWLLIR